MILNSVHVVQSSDGGTSHSLNICSRDKNNEFFFLTLQRNCKNEKNMQYEKFNNENSMGSTVGSAENVV